MGPRQITVRLQKADLRAKDPIVRSTIDNEHRAVLPSPFVPGDVVDIEAQGQDALIVRRVGRSGRSESFRLAETNGELLVVGGPVLTNDDVRRLIEDEA